MTPANQDSRQAISAEKPVPPWERPGSFRRDCEPHRGTLLFWAAAASLVLFLFSLVLFAGTAVGMTLPGGSGWLFVLPVFVAFVGLLLGLATWHLARCDIALMRKGLMDGHGERLTREARNMSLIAGIGSFILFAMIMWPLLGWLIVF